MGRYLQRRYPFQSLWHFVILPQKKRSEKRKRDQSFCSLLSHIENVQAFCFKLFWRYHCSCSLKSVSRVSTIGSFPRIKVAPRSSSIPRDYLQAYFAAEELPHFLRTSHLLFKTTTTPQIFSKITTSSIINLSAQLIPSHSHDIYSFHSSLQRFIGRARKRALAFRAFILPTTMGYA